MLTHVCRLPSLDEAGPQAYDRHRPTGVREAASEPKARCRGDGGVKPFGLAVAHDRARGARRSRVRLAIAGPARGWLAIRSPGFRPLSPRRVAFRPQRGGDFGAPPNKVAGLVGVPALPRFCNHPTDIPRGQIIADGDALIVNATMGAIGPR
jgi:hypothetical protein